MPKEQNKHKQYTLIRTIMPYACALEKPLVKTTYYPGSNSSTEITSDDGKERITLAELQKITSSEVMQMAEILVEPLAASYRKIFSDPNMSSTPYLSPLERGLAADERRKELADVFTYEALSGEVRGKADDTLIHRKIIGSILGTTSPNMQLTYISLLLKQEFFKRILLENLAKNLGDNSPEYVLQKTELEKIFNRSLQMGGLETLSPNKLVAQKKMLDKFSQQLDGIIDREASYPHEYIEKIWDLKEQVQRIEMNLAYTMQYLLENNKDKNTPVPAIVTILKDLMDRGILTQTAWSEVCKNAVQSDDQVVRNLSEYLPQDLSTTLSSIKVVAKKELQTELEVRSKCFISSTTNLEEMLNTTKGIESILNMVTELEVFRDQNDLMDEDSEFGKFAAIKVILPELKKLQEHKDYKLDELEQNNTALELHKKRIISDEFLTNSAQIKKDGKLLLENRHLIILQISELNTQLVETKKEALSLLKPYQAISQFYERFCIEQDFTPKSIEQAMQDFVKEKPAMLEDISKYDTSNILGVGEHDAKEKDKKVKALMSEQALKAAMMKEGHWGLKKVNPAFAIHIASIITLLPSSPEDIDKFLRNIIAEIVRLQFNEMFLGGVAARRSEKEKTDRITLITACDAFASVIINSEGKIVSIQLNKNLNATQILKLLTDLATKLSIDKGKTSDLATLLSMVHAQVGDKYLTVIAQRNAELEQAIKDNLTLFQGISQEAAKVQKMIAQLQDLGHSNIEALVYSRTIVADLEQNLSILTKLLAEKTEILKGLNTAATKELPGQLSRMLSIEAALKAMDDPVRIMEALTTKSAEAEVIIKEAEVYLQRKLTEHEKTAKSVTQELEFESINALGKRRLLDELKNRIKTTETDIKGLSNDPSNHTKIQDLKNLLVSYTERSKELTRELQEGSEVNESRETLTEKLAALEQEKTELEGLVTKMGKYLTDATKIDKCKDAIKEVKTAQDSISMLNIQNQESLREIKASLQEQKQELSKLDEQGQELMTKIEANTKSLSELNEKMLKNQQDAQVTLDEVKISIDKIEQYSNAGEYVCRTVIREGFSQEEKQELFALSYGVKHLRDRLSKIKNSKSDDYKKVYAKLTRLTAKIEEIHCEPKSSNRKGLFTSALNIADERINGGGFRKRLSRLFFKTSATTDEINRGRTKAPAAVNTRELRQQNDPNSYQVEQDKLVENRKALTQLVQQQIAALTNMGTGADKAKELVRIIQQQVDLIFPMAEGNCAETNAHMKKEQGKMEPDLGHQLKVGLISAPGRITRQGLKWYYDLKVASGLQETAVGAATTNPVGVIGGLFDTAYAGLRRTMLNSDFLSNPAAVDVEKTRQKDAAERLPAIEARSDLDAKFLLFLQGINDRFNEAFAKLGQLKCSIDKAQQDAEAIVTKMNAMSPDVFAQREQVLKAEYGAVVHRKKGLAAEYMNTITGIQKMNDKLSAAFAKLSSGLLEFLKGNPHTVSIDGTIMKLVDNMRETSKSLAAIIPVAMKKEVKATSDVNKHIVQNLIASLDDFVEHYKGRFGAKVATPSGVRQALDMLKNDSGSNQEKIAKVTELFDRKCNRTGKFWPIGLGKNGSKRAESNSRCAQIRYSHDFYVKACELLKSESRTQLAVDGVRIEVSAPERQVQTQVQSPAAPTITPLALTP